MQTNSIKQKINGWFSELFKAIGKHLLSLIFVIIIYVIFRAPQINDLILIIIQDDCHAVIMSAFYALIIALAFVIANGHLLLRSNNDTRPLHFNSGIKVCIDNLLYNLNPQDQKEWNLYGTNTNRPKAQVNQIELLYPKLLATLFILSIAFAVDAAYDEFYGKHILFNGYWAFIIISVLMILATSTSVRSFVQRLFPKDVQSSLPLIIAGLCFTIILFLGTINQRGTPGDFKRLFVSLLALSILFYTLSISYHPRLIAIKRRFGIAFGLVLILATLFTYTILLFWPDTNLGSPINVILVSLNTIFILLMTLRIVGSYRQFPYLPIAVILAITATFIIANSKYFGHYKIELLKTDKAASERISLSEYADKWIKARQDEITAIDSADAPFPIILVSAEGGGSRAGHWSLLVHSYLYKNNPNYFHKHLFSLTGASGGSVGNNLFYTVAHNNKQKRDTSVFSSDKNPFRYKASNFYSHDYIGTSIAALLGSDLLASTTTLSPAENRGKLLDLAWEKSFKEYFNFDGLSQPYPLPTYQPDFVPPLLITNTTKVQNGKLNIISPVQFEPSKPFSLKSTETVNSKHRPTSFYFEDLLALVEQKHGKKSIKQSTAMRFNASFPYLSPNGRIDQVGQFGDSGYYDNIGGVVTRRLEQALLEALDHANIDPKKVKIEHLIIVNNPDLKAADCVFKQKKEDSVPNINQLISPAKMLLKATFAHPEEYILAASDRFRIESKRTEIRVADSSKLLRMVNLEEETYCPIIPLGRYMSTDALKSLEKRLDSSEVTNQLNSLLSQMTPFEKD